MVRIQHQFSKKGCNSKEGQCSLYVFAPSSEGIHFQTYITAILVIAASAFLHQPFILVTPGNVQVLSLTAHVAKM